MRGDAEDGGSDPADEYEFSRPSLRVLEAVAEAEGVDPATLDPPLVEVVDPVALDRLFEPVEGEDSSPCGFVSLQFHGYDVTVSSSGRVDLS